MGAPFTTSHPLTDSTEVITPATDKQISFALVPLLDDRDWTSTATSPVKFIERVAVLKLVIAWSLSPMGQSTPPEISRVINDTVGRRGSLGERVNAILSHLANKGDDYTRNNVALYKPLTKKGASALIDWLYTRERVSTPVGDVKPGATVPEPIHPEVPAGRYALPIENSAVGNDLAFYRVDRPTEGKWAGFVFVKLLVGGDEQRLGRAQSEGVLKRIAEHGVEAAAVLYGLNTEHCGFCNTRLTNKASRERGIGPDCAKKHGW